MVPFLFFCSLIETGSDPDGYKREFLQGGSVSPQVARSARIIEKSALPCGLNSRSICFEGRWPEVLKVADPCFKDPQKDCELRCI